MEQYSTCTPQDEISSWIPCNMKNSKHLDIVDKQEGKNF